MTTRKNEPETKKIQPPTTASGWNLLLSQAIKKADAKGDNRLAGLRRAMAEGTAERTLRRFGILSATDLQREFPD